MSNSSGSVTSATPVVAVQGLSKSYGEVRALDGIDFEVPGGAVVAFLGPNGAGKTTAIKILTGYLGADAGSASVCGFNVADPNAGLEARRRIGYLPENNPLYHDMRVCDLLRFAARAQGSGGDSVQGAIDRAVMATGLAEVYRQFVGSCSKGFRQRVGLAQALVHDPPLLILDEPTNGLDPLQVVEIRNLIRTLGADKTVLLTTHVLPEVEALADRVVMIHRGRKQADGSLDAVVAQAETGIEVDIAARCQAGTLRTLVEAIGGQLLAERPSPFALPGVDSLRVRLAEPDAVSTLAAAVHDAGAELIQLSPRTGSLEGLFQRLSAIEVKP